MTLSNLLLDRWLAHMIRAALILLPMAAIFWVIGPRWLRKFRIHQPREAVTLTREELPRTILALSLYMVPFVILVLVKSTTGYSPMYTDIRQHGWGYIALTVVIFAVTVDTWFYWAHRWMHKYAYLKKVHNVHHRSYNPTPATSYSFHIVESFINMAPYAVLFLLLPWHPVAIQIFAIFGTFYVGYVHLGYDFAFEWRSKNPILKWMYTSTHHSIHHQKYDGNFGVYFTFWDKLMGTEILPERSSS